MTNSPGYDWHLLNLRNYSNLRPQAPAPRSIDGVSLAPFGAGSGMLGLPGDFTPPSQFIRAVAFVNTMVPVKDAAEAVSAASVMLNNFDIPKGLVREGSPEDFHLGYTQWSVIADMSHKVYYLLDHVRPQNARGRSLQAEFREQSRVLFPARSRADRRRSRPLKRLFALIFAHLRSPTNAARARLLFLEMSRLCTPSPRSGEGEAPDGVRKAGAESTQVGSNGHAIRPSVQAVGHTPSVGLRPPPSPLRGEGGRASASLRKLDSGSR